MNLNLFSINGKRRQCTIALAGVLFGSSALALHSHTKSAKPVPSPKAPAPAKPPAPAKLGGNPATGGQHSSTEPANRNVPAVNSIANNQAKANDVRSASTKSLAKDRSEQATQPVSPAACIWPWTGFQGRPGCSEGQQGLNCTKWRGDHQAPQWPDERSA